MSHLSGLKSPIIALIREVFQLPEYPIIKRNSQGLISIFMSLKIILFLKESVRLSIFINFFKDISINLHNFRFFSTFLLFLHLFLSVSKYLLSLN
jgi:hypothetical protein